MFKTVLGNLLRKSPIHSKAARGGRGPVHVLVLPAERGPSDRAAVQHAAAALRAERRLPPQAQRQRRQGRRQEEEEEEAGHLQIRSMLFTYFNS